MNRGELVTSHVRLSKDIKLNDIIENMGVLNIDDNTFNSNIEREETERENLKSKLEPVLENKSRIRTR